MEADGRMQGINISILQADAWQVFVVTLVWCYSIGC